MGAEAVLGPAPTARPQARPPGRHLARPLGRDPAGKRARLRAAAAAQVAAAGLAGFNLHALAPRAGIKFDLARHYYRTNAALLAEVVAEQQILLGEAMARPVAAARQLSGAARVEALAAALLDGLGRTAAGHRASRAVLAGLPGVAAELRHADAWLVDLFVEALEGCGVAPAGVSVLARSVVWLLGEWGARLAGADAPARAACARVVAGMVVACAGRGAAAPRCRDVARVGVPQVPGTQRTGDKDGAATAPGAAPWTNAVVTARGYRTRRSLPGR